MKQGYISPDLQLQQTLTKAAAKPLSRIRGANNTSRHKKINTIMHIVLCEMQGKGWHNDELWGRPDTCNETTFYKWKANDPDFWPVLEEVREIAGELRVKFAAATVAEASIILQNLAADAARRMGDLMRQEQDLSVARLAAADVLNRNRDTAPQQGIQLTSDQERILNMLYGEGGEAADAAAPTDPDEAEEE